MEIDQALEETGFVKYQFGPDSDPCEKCEVTHKQLYFGNACYEYPNDGDYYCADCVIDVAKSNRDYIEHCYREIKNMPETPEKAEG